MIANKNPSLSPLVYSISAAGLYGTERVAIDTLVAFSRERKVILLAPDGPAVALGQSKGIETQTFGSLVQKALLLFKLSWRLPCMKFITISVVDSYLYWLARVLQLRSLGHVHVIHGSGFPARSYVSKRYLRGLPIKIVAVSDYAKERLCEFSGLPSSRIRVIENFISDAQIRQVRQRGPYSDDQRVQKVITISRIEQPKRIDLLIEAVQRYAALASFSFEIFGAGPELEHLRARAAAANIPEAQLKFCGFQPDASSRIKEFDLLLHLCPVEGFGTVYLEAMAAGVVAVGPNRGSRVLTNRRTGFLFAADDPSSMATTLLEIRALGADALNNVALEARHELITRYSESRALTEYRRAIEAT
jgi:glycosyltransferase involved in cell wall biosynthesis